MHLPWTTRICGPSIQRLRDQFSTVWEVSSLSLRIHMVDEGMGVTFIDRKLLEEHPSCANFRIMDDVSFGRIDKEVGLYSSRGQESERQREELYRSLPELLEAVE